MWVVVNMNYYGQVPSFSRLLILCVGGLWRLGSCRFSVNFGRNSFEKFLDRMHDQTVTSCRVAAPGRLAFPVMPRPRVIPTFYLHSLVERRMDDRECALLRRIRCNLLMHLSRRLVARTPKQNCHILSVPGDDS